MDADSPGRTLITDADYDYHDPLPASIASMAMSVVALPILGACLTRRLQRVHAFSRIPISAALLLLVYTDSLLFLGSSAIIKVARTSRSMGWCRGAYYVCGLTYFSTKVLIYLFLTEKAWIVRGRLQRRRDSKLWLFNVFGMMIPYSACTALYFIYRKANIGPRGRCTIGIEKPGIVILLACEVLINMYLNFLFISPLRKLYSYHHGDVKMRTLALRTFIGGVLTTVISVSNITVSMIMDGQPGWLCLLTCNLDILFCVVILHWVTALDSGGDRSNPQACSCSHPSHHTTFPKVGADLTLPEPVAYMENEQTTHLPPWLARRESADDVDAIVHHGASMGRWRDADKMVC